MATPFSTTITVGNSALGAAGSWTSNITSDGTTLTFINTEAQNAAAAAGLAAGLSFLNPAAASSRFQVPTFLLSLAAGALLFCH